MSFIAAATPGTTIDCTPAPEQLIHVARKRGQQNVKSEDFTNLHAPWPLRYSAEVFS